MLWIKTISEITWNILAYLLTYLTSSRPGHFRKFGKNFENFSSARIKLCKQGAVVFYFYYKINPTKCKDNSSKTTTQLITGRDINLVTRARVPFGRHQESRLWPGAIFWECVKCLLLIVSQSTLSGKNSESAHIDRNSADSGLSNWTWSGPRKKKETKASSGDEIGAFCDQNSTQDTRVYQAAPRTELDRSWSRNQPGARQT